MVSIKDVAKKADVAISTVSKVINGYPNVSKKTKEKVLAAIEELNYTPNIVAASLSSKQASRVAILMKITTQTQAIDEIAMQYLYGALTECTKNRMDVVTIFYETIKDMNLVELTTYFYSQHIGGLVVYGLSTEDEILKSLIQKEVFKVVVIDAPFVNDSTSCIGIDHKKAQKDVAKKTILENSGHKILYIEGKTNGYVTRERTKGMIELSQELNLLLEIRQGEFSELRARTITFEVGKEYDIIICASDLMAIGAMKSLIELDIFRPVCGFDGITLMGYVGQQMNTVKQDFSNVSRNAIIELQQLMIGARGRKVILPHTLVKLEYLEIIK
ncbi:MAG: LacI family DNA-binding transcriptional regulator [Lachnospiraceae bacterium]